MVNVVGMGAVCAAGIGLTEISKSFKNPYRNPKFPKRISTTLDKQYPIFEIDNDFDLADTMYRTNKLAEIAYKEAIESTGKGFDKFKNYKIAVTLGTTTAGCTLTITEKLLKESSDTTIRDERFINATDQMDPAKYLAASLGLNCTAISIANACSSGTDSIGLASNWIESGKYDVVICGGSDAISRISYLGFQSLQVYSDEPCRPFDKSRKGLNLGEGAGILILVSNKVVKELNLKVIGNVLSYATFTDGYHLTAPSPDARGLKKAIKTAVKKANIDINEIDFVNSHGTATTINDKTEGTAIYDMYKKDIPVCATKWYTGHTLGAAGALEAIFTLYSLNNSILQYTPDFIEIDEECFIKPVTEPTTMTSNIAISHSLAFGGNNSVVILSKGDKE